MKKLLVWLAAALVALLAVVALRTVAVRHDLEAVPPAEGLELDVGAAAERLAAAVRVPTVSTAPGVVDDEALGRLQALLVESFPRLHATLERELVDGRSLLYRWAGRDPAAPPVVLCSHLDVVPVPPGSEASWTRPPFDGVIADGFVWGRGTLDDKVGVLAILEAVEALLAAGFEPPRTVWLAFGHDEEVFGSGAVAMARILAERGVAAALVLDEGMTLTRGIVPAVARPVALVGVAEKGYATLLLTARGEGGHSSMPPHPTAVGALARAVARLDAEPLPAVLEGPARGLLESLAPEMAWPTRAAVANLWLTAHRVERLLAGKPSTNALLRTTTAPTMLEGSPKENVLASSARAWVNFRIHPNDSLAGVVAAVERIVDDPAITVEVLPGASEPSPVSPSDGPAFDLVARSIRQVFPEAVVAPSLVVGATDARHYAGLSKNVYRFLPVVVEPADLPRFHGIDERVAVEGYGQAVRFYAQLLRNLDGL